MHSIGCLSQCGLGTSVRGEIGDGSGSSRSALEGIVDAEFEDFMEGEDEESEENSSADLEENVSVVDLEENDGYGDIYGGEQSSPQLSVLDPEINESFGGRVGNDEHVETQGESSQDSERKRTQGQFEGSESFSGALSGNSEDRVADYAREIDERKQSAKEQRDRIQKAKKRRYAARASGAKYLPGGLDGKNGTGWWLHEFVGINQTGKFRLKLWPPDRQSPGIVRRAEASHAPVDVAVVASQQADRLDAEAARLEAQLAALKGN